MKKIEDFAKHQECPLIDGIIFPDETIQLLNVVVDWATPRHFKVALGAKTSISLIQKREKLSWISCTTIIELIDQEHSFKVIAGESSYGSDGFVCVLDLTSEKLRWLAFFQESNPFSKLEICGEELNATSTLNCVWKFKLDNPVDCRVECYVYG